MYTTHFSMEQQARRAIQKAIDNAMLPKIPAPVSKSKSDDSVVIIDDEETPVHSNYKCTCSGAQHPVNSVEETAGRIVSRAIDRFIATSALTQNATCPQSWHFGKAAEQTQRQTSADLFLPSPPLTKLEETACRIIQDSVDQGLLKMNSKTRKRNLSSGRLYEFFTKVVDFLRLSAVSQLFGLQTGTSENVKSDTKNPDFETRRTKEPLRRPKKTLRKRGNKKISVEVLYRSGQQAAAAKSRKRKYRNAV